MKNRFILVVSFFSILMACKREVPSEQTPSTHLVNSMNDMKVPAGFNYLSSRTVEVDIGMNDQRVGSYIQNVEVYDGDPGTGAGMLAMGALSNGERFKTKISLPGTIEKLFVKRVLMDGTSNMREIPITGNRAAATFIGESIVQIGKGTTPGPDCSSGCTNTSNTTMSSGATVSSGTTCYTGTSINGSLTVNNGATARVCGTGTITSVTLNGTGSLVIASNANITIGAITYNSTSASFYNYSNNTILSSNQTITGTFRLEANISASSRNITINSGGSYYNNGGAATFNVITVNTGGSFNNAAGTTQCVDLDANSGATFSNACYVYATDDIELNCTSTHSVGLLRAADNIEVQSSCSLTVGPTTQMNCDDLILNGVILSSSYSSSVKCLVKVIDDTEVGNGGRLSSGTNNIIYLCDENGIETNNAGGSLLAGGSQNSCNGINILTTNCNSLGHTGVVDADSDGVADESDAYPSDATKAYNTYYPASVSGTYPKYTLCFEDLWPSTGDYDLNDLVMGYSYQLVTNASNQVVQVIGNYVLRATGGSLTNAFAIEFPVSRGSVSTTTGANTLTTYTGGNTSSANITPEAGQTNAVFQLFSNSRTYQFWWNTILTDPTSDSSAFVLSFTLSTPIALSTFGQSSYNPFLWRNQNDYGRGYEIHLSGDQPTSLATTSVFGTVNDATNLNTSVRYLTSTNLPWALDIPGTFIYMKESTDITTGYTRFDDWAESGGVSYTDWYSNTASGYRDNTKLYIR